MRQWSCRVWTDTRPVISELPMRQWRPGLVVCGVITVSELPMRQWSRNAARKSIASQWVPGSIFIFALFLYLLLTG